MKFINHRDTETQRHRENKDKIEKAKTNVAVLKAGEPNSEKEKFGTLCLCG